MKARVIVAATGCTVALVGLGPAEAKVAPKLHVGTTPTLSVVGTGFAPRVFVTVRIAAPGLLRTAKTRTGSLGGFTLRFPLLERCAPVSVTARTANGIAARVPVAWFTRECVPPPPVQPGVPPPIN